MARKSSAAPGRTEASTPRRPTHRRCGGVEHATVWPRVVARNNETPRGKKGPALGEILVERKTLTTDQLREAMARQQRSRKRLGEILMELGFADADSVLDGLSAQLGVPPTRVNSFTVTPEALSCLSERVARKYTAVPMLKIGSTLVVATANPRDLQALDDLRFAAGCEIQTMIALESEIQQALESFYGNPFGADESEPPRSSWTCRVRSSICRTRARTKSATSIVDRILARGVGDRASDIHLEPTKHSLRIRFRVDGMLHEVADLLPALASGGRSRVEESGRDGHRRAPQPAGRPLQRDDQQPQPRRQRLDLSDDLG